MSPPSRRRCTLCVAQVLVADALSELEPQNILMPPRQMVARSELEQAADSDEQAQSLYDRMCDAVGTSGVGVVRTERHAYEGCVRLLGSVWTPARGSTPTV